jgi:hypothetical protein
MSSHWHDRILAMNWLAGVAASPLTPKKIKADAD